jgi:hypothetical protein
MVGTQLKPREGQKIVFSIVGSKSYTLTIGSTKQSQCTVEDDAMVLENVIVEGINVANEGKI